MRANGPVRSNPTAHIGRSLGLALLLAVLVIVIVACGDDDDGSATTEAADEPADPTTAEEFDDYLGLSEDEAGERADSEGRPWRVVERDGESLPITMDLVEDRLNFVVEGGNVTAVTTG